MTTHEQYLESLVRESKPEPHFHVQWHNRMTIGDEPFFPDENKFRSFEHCVEFLSDAYGIDGVEYVVQNSINGLPSLVFDGVCIADVVAEYESDDSWMDE